MQIEGATLVSTRLADSIKDKLHGAIVLLQHYVKRVTATSVGQENLFDQMGGL